MDVAIDRDDRTKVAYTQATGGQQRPLLILAGLTWFQLKFCFDCLKQFTTSDDMARQAFTEKDHMPAALLGWQHAVEGGNGENLSQRDGSLVADLVKSLAGDVSETLGNLVQDGYQVPSVSFGLLQDQGYFLLKFINCGYGLSWVILHHLPL